MFKSKVILLLIAPSFARDTKKELLDLQSNLDSMLENVQDYTKSEMQLGKSAMAKDANLSFYKVRASESEDLLSNEVSYDYQDAKPKIKAFYNKYTGTKAPCGAMRVRNRGVRAS